MDGQDRSDFIPLHKEKETEQICLSKKNSRIPAHSYPNQYTEAVRQETKLAYERVKHVIPEFEWPVLAPLIHAINRLKQEKNAVILAHNYMTPDIFGCIGDYTGDSLGLARKAAELDSEIIVQAGVHFMAETSKILCLEKTVLIPNLKAGCSLASSIQAKDVRLIREKYPDTPIVTYVNTSAEVKAESDICCTSSNAVQVVESLNKDHVIMIPDEYLARNVAAQTSVKITSWKGRCEVHEQFKADDINELRESYPNAIILAHPECSPSVTKLADFTGSTAAMSSYVKNNQPSQVVMITECSMSDNVSSENPNVHFIRPCNLCPHMKRITLKNIYDALLYNQYEVKIDTTISKKAKKAIDHMLALPRPKTAAKFDPVKHYPDIALIE